MKANIVKINTLAPLTSSEGEGVAAAAAAGFVVEAYFVHTSLALFLILGRCGSCSCPYHLLCSVMTSSSLNSLRTLIDTKN